MDAVTPHPQVVLLSRQNVHLQNKLVTMKVLLNIKEKELEQARVKISALTDCMKQLRVKYALTTLVSTSHGCMLHAACLFVQGEALDSAAGRISPLLVMLHSRREMRL